MLLMKDRSFLYELRAYLIYVKVGERKFLYELRAYLIYVNVGERSFLYELRARLIYVKVGELYTLAECANSFKSTLFALAWMKLFFLILQTQFSSFRPVCHTTLKQNRFTSDPLFQRFYHFTLSRVISI